MREWLAKKRAEKGLAMKEMGLKLGVSESYYCAIENGTRKKRIDITLIVGIAEAFEIPVDSVIQCEIEYLSGCAIDDFFVKGHVATEKADCHASVRTGSQ